MAFWQLLSAPNSFSARAPDPAGGAYNAPPDTLAGLRGPTSSGEGKAKGGRGKRRREGRGQHANKSLKITFSATYILQKFSDKHFRNLTG